MDLIFVLNKTKTHFNATIILKQINLDFASNKRFNDFASQTKIKLTCRYIDAERVEHMQRTLEFRPGRTPPTQVRVPSISVVGGGKTKTTWLHVSLLALFLHWLHPQAYARFFAAPKALVTLRNIAVEAQI